MYSKYGRSATSCPDRFAVFLLRQNNLLSKSGKKFLEIYKKFDRMRIHLVTPLGVTDKKVAGVAQLVEQRIRNAKVGCSIPLTGTTEFLKSLGTLCFEAFVFLDPAISPSHEKSTLPRVRKMCFVAGLRSGYFRTSRSSIRFFTIAVSAGTSTTRCRRFSIPA